MQKKVYKVVQNLRASAGFELCASVDSDGLGYAGAVTLEISAEVVVQEYSGHSRLPYLGVVDLN